MKQTIPVIGMACASCSANVEKKLNSLPGISSAAVSLAGRSALVDYDPEKISLETMKKEINGIGYDLVIEKDRSVEEIQKREYTILTRKTILSWILSIVGMTINMHWINVGGVSTANQIGLLIALANMFFCGRSFYVTTVRQIRHGAANMDTLVALSTSIAFIFSAYNTFWGDPSLTYFDSCGMIITFVLTGRMLEEKAKDSTATSIRQLMGMAPKTAHIVEDGEVREVPISTIDVGDVLEVRPGEKVPVDGEVISAESFMTADAAYVDESMITGEPTPAEKKKGSKVLAGTIPSQGKFRMRARQVGENTALAHIIRMVQEAEGSKAPVQRIVDKAVMVFVPVVGTLALITFFLWWGLGGTAMLPKAIVSAVTVLVIACPCAMGLATPTALMVGIGKAADKHVLIKDATALERMRKVDVLVTDKTGTLTIPNQNVDFTKADNLPLESRETLKPHAAEAMKELQDKGIDVWMMSGDKEEAAKYWADKAGIKHYKAKCVPQDKENIVRQLKSEGKTVAMIGDGINDTQALALADVSIAIGTGTDVAMDVAQVTLMTDDLRALPFSFTLSKKTTRMIWENLFWAFIYNIICIPLAAGVLYLFYDNPPIQLTPMWGSALMAFSSVSVVLNSLRLKLV
jgi:Cu2+-exporting ATPase